MKKVVFILPTFDAGGAERVMISLMNSLPRAQFQKTMIVVDLKGPLGGLIGEDARVVDLKRSVRGFSAIPALLSALRRVKPDVVVSTMAGLNFKVLLLRRFFPRTRFIVREAITPSYFFTGNPVRIAAIRAAYRFLYPMADLVVSPSQAIIDEFAGPMGMPGLRQELLFNPVDMEKVRGGAFTPERGDAVHFVAAGRLNPQKGYDRLIEGLAGFAPGYEWRVTILGEGPERQRLEDMVRENGLEGRVSMPGHSDFPWAAISSAHAFLLPSRYEGLPNVALEALACGAPVIATVESGGIAEIAANARPGAVTVAADMTQFMAAMRAVRPAAITARRESLLSPGYDRVGIEARFAGFLAT
jgi:glycosyltransferase involved in cell wall biosynthesis